MKHGARLDMRVPPDLKQALEEFAEADRRRLTDLVRIVLEDYVAERRQTERKRK